MTYVVTKQGVYLQDVFGPFEGLTEARLFAQQRAAHDADGYHTWDIGTLHPEGLKVVERYAQQAMYPRRPADVIGVARAPQEVS